MLIEDREAQCEDILYASILISFLNNIILISIREIVRGKKRKRKGAPSTSKAEKESKKKKPKRQSSAPRQTKKQKETAIEVHKAHLTCLLIHHLNVNKQLDDEVLKVRKA